MAEAARPLGDDEPVMPPLYYVSRSTLARALDMAPSTVDEMVKRGVLPKPVKLSGGCVRWRWASVEKALASLEPGTESAPVDPYIAGALNATETAGAGHG